MNANIDCEPALPFVILPGLLCDSRMFQAQVQALNALVIDGFYGLADRLPAMVNYALERMPAKCVLLGHSMGARVALEIWRRTPERIAKLVLADTGVHPPKESEQKERYALRDFGYANGSSALVDRWLPPMVGKSHRDDCDLMTTLRAMACDAGVDTFARQIEALLHRPDAALVLPTITCPTLVMVGSEDQWSPVRQHEDLAASVPGSKLAVVEHAGHMAPAEEPRQFNAIICDWLNQRQIRSVQVVSKGGG